MAIKVNEIVGTGIPVRGNDIDTDRIIPARFLKCVTFDGIGEHAFADDIAQLAEKGITHSFKKPEYQNAKILVSNQNFGCGSSREHAPQSLKRWGIDAIIAESYSEIFYGNCVSLAVPCFVTSNPTARKIQDFIEANPSTELKLSVEERAIWLGDEKIELEIKDGARGQLLDGSWDARSSLVANMDNIQNIAKQLPYVGDYA